mgnify:CR=1 FL=1
MFAVVHIAALEGNLILEIIISTRIELIGCVYLYRLRFQDDYTITVYGERSHISAYVQRELITSLLITSLLITSQRSEL